MFVARLSSEEGARTKDEPKNPTNNWKRRKQLKTSNLKTAQKKHNTLFALRYVTCYNDNALPELVENS